MSKPLGMRVKVVWSEACPFQERSPSREFRNVTEIHWRYPLTTPHAGGKENPPGLRVAFESDVHATGQTVNTCWIAEFEAKLEFEEAAEF